MKHPPGSALAFISRLCDLLSGVALIVAGVLLVFVTAYTLLESALRSTLGLSTYVLTEVVGYSLAPMTTLAMAGTLRGGMLIRVNLLTAQLGARAARIAELACVLTTLALSLWIVKLFGAEAVFNWQRGAVSETISRVPLWIPPILVLSGFPIFVLQLLLYAAELVCGRAPIQGSEASSV